MDSPRAPTHSIGNNRKGSIDSAELDAYFASSYVPPSNLPTPPPSPGARQFLIARKPLPLATRKPTPIPPPQSYFSDSDYSEDEDEDDSDSLSDEEEDDDQLTGMASHASYIANALPRHASRYRPNPLIIHSFLLRSSLPIETIALASCFLASLSPSFPSAYRDACTKSSSRPSSPRTPVTSSTFPPQEETSHFDAFPSFHPTQGSSSNPDLLVLASLLLAFAFLDDRKAGLAYWSGFVSSGLYTEGQVSTASDCVLKDLGYRLFGFEEPVRATVEDMTRRGSEVRWGSVTW